MARKKDDRRNRKTQLTPEGRRFLEQLLKDLHKEDLPGGQQLISMVENTLAGKPVSELSDLPEAVRGPSSSPSSSASESEAEPPDVTVKLPVKESRDVA